MDIHKVVVPILFCLCMCVAANSVVSRTSSRTTTRSVSAELFPPDKLIKDLDFLFTTIAETHPNMYAYINKERYALVRSELYKHIDHEMTISEFYLYVRTVVSCLKDSHTRIERPSNFIMPQITESMQEFGERLKELVKDNKSAKTNAPYVPAPRKKAYMGPYSYHFFPEYDTCLMVINWFGMPNEVEQYTNKFEETFEAIREKGITHLVIDVRQNGGGCGLTGDELLKYLADRPFRQVQKVEQKIVPEFFELCEQYGLNMNKTMSDEYGIDLENLKSKGDYRPGIIVTGQGQFKEPHKPSDRFKGAIYLLIAEPTFSAASNFAAAVKYFEIGTLIGQQTSGEKDHYGQVLPIQLPHSGLKGQVSTAHFITVGGMEDRSSIKPDYEVWQKPEDTVKSVDTVLEFALGLIKNSEAKK